MFTLSPIKTSVSYGTIISRFIQNEKEKQMQNPLIPNNNTILQRFQQFQRMFKGNPQEQVQQLLNSGKVSQAQYNQAVQMANQLQKILSGK
jgi:hypothetical protein